MRPLFFGCYGISWFDGRRGAGIWAGQASSVETTKDSRKGGLKSRFTKSPNSLRSDSELL